MASAIIFCFDSFPIDAFSDTLQLISELHWRTITDDSDVKIRKNGTLTLLGKTWKEARRRVAIIGPLAKKEKISTSTALEAREKLGLSARTIYTLIRRYRNSGGLILSLVGSRLHDGRGASST